jgi:hypothetical protein
LATFAALVWLVATIGPLLATGGTAGPGAAMARWLPWLGPGWAAVAALVSGLALGLFAVLAVAAARVGPVPLRTPAE